LANSSQGHARFGTLLALPIIDSVRNTYPRLVGAIDDAAGSSSCMIPVTGYALRGSCFFSLNKQVSWIVIIATMACSANDVTESEDGSVAALKAFDLFYGPGRIYRSLRLSQATSCFAYALTNGRACTSVCSGQRTLRKASPEPACYL